MTAFKVGDRVVRNSTPHAFSSMPNRHFNEAEEGVQGEVRSVSTGFSPVRYSVRWDNGRSSSIEASGIDPVFEKTKAVRGAHNLRPGLYATYWAYSGEKNYWFLTDATVSTVNGLGSKNIQRVRAYRLNGTPIEIYLGDAGITPRNEGGTKTCNLGHQHEAEPVYAESWTERVDTIPTV